MPLGLNIPYLLVLAGISVGVLLTLFFAQKAALKSLAYALYTKDDLAGYNRRLDNPLYNIVLRRSTVALLRLEGAIYAGDPKGVWYAATMLDGKKLKPGETLNYYQKALSFAVTAGDEARAHQYLALLQDFLRGEMDAKLAEVLQEATLLVGVYIDRDTGLISALLDLEAEQTGIRKGMTQYRLAKLYHYAGKANTARCWLGKAEANLQRSPWREVACAALLDGGVLEVQ